MSNATESLLAINRSSIAKRERTDLEDTMPLKMGAWFKKKVVEEKKRQDDVYNKQDEVYKKGQFQGQNKRWILLGALGVIVVLSVLALISMAQHRQHS